MEIIFISDMHTRHQTFTPSLQNGGDVIVCCGDITDMGTEQELRKFVAWYDALPFTYKIVIAGNHDFIFEQSPSLARHILNDTGIIYLENTEVVIDGLKFYGSPVTSNFNNWAFNKNYGAEIQHYWDKIPPDTDILITHGPPLGILDCSRQGLHLGCAILKEAVRKIKPVVHAFGHIHEGYGTVSNEDIYYVNAALLNERYQPVHKPISVQI